MAAPDVCSEFHAKQDEEVNFKNSTGVTCQITGGSQDWPFTDGPPLSVPVGGCKTKIKSKADLPDGTYVYSVDCCSTDSQKSVTVP
ncbi:MAG: hypothetical protein WCD57_01810 [Acidobacteriaceae bacterium]